MPKLQKQWLSGNFKHLSPLTSNHSRHSDAMYKNNQVTEITLPERNAIKYQKKTANIIHSIATSIYPIT